MQPIANKLSASARECSKKTNSATRHANQLLLGDHAGETTIYWWLLASSAEAERGEFVLDLRATKSM